ncbi:hypothetical protein J3U99_19005 [Brucella pituitosa]|nr:hypothetical protein [Brucella pituitosa]MCK4206871.1 hypothetical protein [Brucella pituitosa]
MSIKELHAHMQVMKEEHGVTEPLFLLDLADPIAKRKMISLLGEALADL